MVVRSDDAAMPHDAPPSDHDRERDAVEQACRYAGLDLTHAGSVHAYLAEDEDAWPRCCNSSCDPCVVTLQHAARRALVLLEPPTGRR